MRKSARLSAPPVEWAVRLASSSSSRMRRAVPARLHGVCGHCGRRVRPDEARQSFATGRRYSAATSLSSEETKSNGRYTTHVLGHLKRRGPFLPTAGTSPLQRSNRHHDDKLVVRADHYGKWSELLFDYDRLMFESGLSSGPGQREQQQQRRSVDDPEHATDMGLWSAILNFAQRRGDALVVWQTVVERKQLYEVEGAVAREFWDAVLAAALDMDNMNDDAAATTFLDSTWAYAEWMWATHGVAWPGYYETVVAHFLNAGDYDGAVRWHVRLSAHLGVAKRPFFAMLQGFLADNAGGDHNAEALHEALRHIYATSRHRSLYDSVVPLLWSQGWSSLARAWRDTLTAHGDMPSSSASRPFLHFLHGYYPETALYAEEELILQRTRDGDAAAVVKAGERERGSSGGGFGGKMAGAHGTPAINMFHLINQVHGETFGIAEKKVMDDTMGAKWFATKFVSLDTAIHLLYTLGISEIGPLSLQSIALREGGSPQGVLHRLAQLEQSQISVGRSSYAAAIRHLAATGEAATLRELLQCMVEPAVFDDIVLQRQVMGMAAFKGDWKTYRMILVVRVAASYAAIGTSANRVLLTCLGRGKKAVVLKLLDEFAARDYDLLPATCRAINAHTMQHTQPMFDRSAAPDVDFYAALCRRMAAMRLPVATVAWRNILYILGRSGRLHKTEKTALAIVQAYRRLQTREVGKPAPAASAAAQKDETAFFKVHVDDVPGVGRGSEDTAADPDVDGDDTDMGYRLLPRDLPFSHALHPLGLIFEDNLVRSMVRWYFHRMGSYRHGKKTPLRLPEGEAEASPETEASPEKRPKAKKKKSKRPPPKDPPDYAYAAGIRLLAMLRDRGVDVPMASVRSEALLCILAIFGPDSTVSRVWKPARAANQATLADVKRLCDAAWSGSADATATGETLLPPVEAIEAALEAIVPGSTSFASQISKPGAKGDRRREAQDTFFNVVDAVDADHA